MEKNKQKRTKAEQVQDIKRKLDNINEQIQVLEARKLILNSQLKRLNSKE